MSERATKAHLLLLGAVLELHGPSPLGLLHCSAGLLPEHPTHHDKTRGTMSPAKARRLQVTAAWPNTAAGCYPSLRHRTENPFRAPWHWSNADASVRGVQHVTPPAPVLHHPFVSNLVCRRLAMRHRASPASEVLLLLRSFLRLDLFHDLVHHLAIAVSFHERLSSVRD